MNRDDYLRRLFAMEGIGIVSWGDGWAEVEAQTVFGRTFDAALGLIGMRKRVTRRKNAGVVRVYFEDLPGERFTCPERTHYPGAPGSPRGADRWRTDRWIADEAEAEAERAAYQAANPNLPVALRVWRWDIAVPRTCGFCGGVHPEDAIDLVSEGWVVVKTVVRHKVLLMPPGSVAKRGMVKPSVWRPMPPVKLYTNHMDAATVERFNRVVAKK